MVLFYKGAWQSRYGVNKFYSYITFVCITVILGGISIIMDNTALSSCICEWSQRTLIAMYVICGGNSLIILIRYFCLQNDKYNKNLAASNMEQTPLNIKKKRTKKDVIVVKTKSKKHSKINRSKSKSNIKSINKTTLPQLQNV